MYWLSIIRLVILIWASFCAVVLLGVGAHALSAVGDLRLPTFAWAGLAVATAVLALVSLPAMFIIDLLRMGAFTSMIVVELAWLGFLGVMMLATGGAAAANASGFWIQCDIWSPAAARTVCSETSAAAAFGFLAWVALWAYAVALLVILLIQANRGNYIWQQSVKEMQLKGSNNIPPNSTPGAFSSEKPHEAAALNAVQYSYPPQQGALSPQSTGYMSPQVTGYSHPMPQEPQPGILGQPANPNPTNVYPQV
ncbi:hypothetical protein C8Q80DRAFT_77688 [Daedaleopsis nitida]|nr:hypothetical protein C8Q80DRAFT_77688 [Daedaleopsis nitida]